MRAIVLDEEKRTNVIIYKIYPEGERMDIFIPEAKEVWQFTLRSTGRWVKVGERTTESKTILSFPVLIQKDLVSAFCKRP